VGAKFSGRNFGKDEDIREIAQGYAAKRDRWNGYNPDHYKNEVIDKYHTV